MTRLRLSDFPEAPPNAYVCEEGWLIVGDEAWTVEEWRSRFYGGRPIRFHDEAHRKDRERKRLYYARKRAVA